MNKHIELVKKWLADPQSVTQAELEANADYAYDAAYDAWAAADTYDAANDAAYVAWAAAYAANDAAYVAWAAAYDAARTADAAYWVKRYEELTNE